MVDRVRLQEQPNMLLPKCFEINKLENRKDFRRCLTISGDLWALGCVIFQMLTGRRPFQGENEYQTFQLVINRNFEYPPNFPAVAKDLVDKLLVSLLIFIHHRTLKLTFDWEQERKVLTS